jgi:hypothetical protein
LSVTAQGAISFLPIEGGRLTLRRQAKRFDKRGNSEHDPGSAAKEED